MQCGSSIYSNNIRGWAYKCQLLKAHFPYATVIKYQFLIASISTNHDNMLEMKIPNAATGHLAQHKTHAFPNYSLHFLMI